ncbi:MAG TPA: phosphate starvation-inducible protein PhoH, partial [Acidimicrobiales bacterium]|nr:phosphate starvation-inducible protein PhoH [Acidimicrobiales bacterium]
MTTTQLTIHVPGNHLMRPLLGERDELLRMVEAAFSGAGVHVRGNEIVIGGDDADRVGRLFGELVTLLQAGQEIDPALLAR